MGLSYVKNLPRRAFICLENFGASYYTRAMVVIIVFLD
jgi:hypothetical protein